jgi:putative nucleotidyltransferase with HDIG domain
MREARERFKRRRALAAAMACYLAILALMGSGYYQRPYPTQAGKAPATDIFTPIAIKVLDPDATEKRRERIDSTYPEIWRIDLERDSHVQQQLNSFFDLMRSINPRTPQQFKRFVDSVNDQLGIQLKPNDAAQLLPDRLQALDSPLSEEFLQKQLRLILDNVFGVFHVISSEQRGKYQAHLASGRLRLEDRHGSEQADKPDPNGILPWQDGFRNYLTTQALPGLLPGEGRRALHEALTELLVALVGGPDVQCRDDLTKEAHEHQLQSLVKDPSYKTYQPKSLVAEKDVPLNAMQANALAQLNTSRRATILTKLLGIMLIAALIMLAMALYLTRFRSGFAPDAKGVLMHALPVILGLAVGQGIFMTWKDPITVKLCFPAALVGLLATMMINARAGFVLVLVTACLFGIVNGQDIEFLVLALFGGFATVLASRRLRERADLIRVSWKVGLVNVAVVMIFTLIDGIWRPDPIGLIIVFLNAMACVGASQFILWFCERHLGIVTDLRLLELTGLRHPLIVQMEEKAPGSYQHVLNVMKLAEAAANAIGANYLLVRAGALFHDIGKIVKPKYFSENQVTLEDKKAHAKLSPYMSVLIIKNHVKEGIELAKRYGLPQAIIDFIPQHHGTGLIRYFYGAAQSRYEESAAADPVHEEDFRYSGPRPQTVEAAIVMLADSVEAIAASKFTGGQITEDEIRRMAQMAITERFNDGQFDECDLTMRHLRDMREALVRTLMARYHFRVAYPTLARPASPRPGEGAMRGDGIAIAGPASREGAAAG